MYQESGEESPDETFSEPFLLRIRIEQSDFQVRGIRYATETACWVVFRVQVGIVSENAIKTEERVLELIFPSFSVFKGPIPDENKAMEVAEKWKQFA